MVRLRRMSHRLAEVLENKFHCKMLDYKSSTEKCWIVRVPLLMHWLKDSSGYIDLYTDLS